VRSNLGVVLVRLSVADITRGTGRFNLGLGIVGSAVGIGAALSTTLAGYAMDHFGSSVAFFSLAFIGACGLALLDCCCRRRVQIRGNSRLRLKPVSPSIRR